MSDSKMTFHVETRRLSSHGSLSRCKDAEIPLDTDLAGHRNAFNEDLATKYQLSREEQDRWALRSQQRFSTA
jgi:acetyl-CoA acetyltransferase